MPRSAISLAVLIVLVTGMAIPAFSGGQPNKVALAATAADDNAISIKSISTRYDSEFESFHIFGELVNNLKTAVQDVKLNITFYDSQGNLTGTIISAPYFGSLVPGEKSAFDIVAQGKAASDLRDFSYYKISRIWETAEVPKEKLLRLDIREMSLDSCGYHTIQGTVTNLARQHTSGISISAAFYNEENQIIATAFTRISDRLDPTRSGEFTLTVDQQALPHFAYYSLNTQSDLYTTSAFEGEDDLTNFHSLKPIGGKLMTVSTLEQTYTIKDDKISVAGLVPPEEVKKREPNSLVLIKVLTGSGLVPVLVTAPVPASGVFTRELEFQMDESMMGQAYRIRAEYFGMYAESTFSVAHAPVEDGQPMCDRSDKIAIAELKANLGETGGNITSFISGRELKQGSAVTLAATLDSEVSREQNVTVIFEVFDSQGVVVYLQVAEYEVAPNTLQDLQVSWNPESEGTFVIKSFVVSSLYQPVLISKGAPLSVKVLS